MRIYKKDRTRPKQEKEKLAGIAIGYEPLVFSNQGRTSSFLYGMKIKYKPGKYKY